MHLCKKISILTGASARRALAQVHSHCLAFTSVLLALFLLSCTKEEAQDRVPVQLGVGSVKSKAGALESLTMLQGKTFGLLAAGDENKPLPVLYNGNAEFRGEGVSMSVSFPGEESEDGILYYPLGSENNYSFYACCFGGKEGVEYYLSMQTPVPEGIYGMQDILWAKSQATTDLEDKDGEVVKGFNARYIRLLLDQVRYDCFPRLDFHHVTSAIRFKLGVEDEDMQDSGFTVVSTAMNNVSSTAVLDMETGILDDNGNRDACLEYADQTFTPTVDGMRMDDDAFFIAPGEYPDLEFQFQFKVASDAPILSSVISSQEILEYLVENFNKGTIALDKGIRYTFEVVFKRDGDGYKAELKSR